MSRFLRIAALGLRSLGLHPLRSFLTALGIIIGVGTVIYMLALIEGRAREIQDRIRARGSTNILIKARKPSDDGRAVATRSREIQYGLTYDDARRVRETFPEVEVIVPVRDVNGSIYQEEMRLDTIAMATVPWYLEVARGKLARGRWFTDVEFGTTAPVGILGSELAVRLFAYRDPLNAKVRLGSKVFTVIGVLEPTITSDPKEALKKDRALFIPLSTVRERFGERNVKTTSGSMDIERVELHEIMVQVKKPSDVIPTASAIAGMLAAWHKNDDYELDVPLALLREAEEEAKKSRKQYGAIAAISLLVGGIGIMNIMLASVTERTREIGIRRALGARRIFITSQFLIETLILSVVGGLIGVAGGIGAAYIHSALDPNTRTNVTIASVLLAFGISALVGVLAGLYPAVRASRMDPIEALRHD